MSVEVDILPLVEDAIEAARLADLIEGVAGEWSPFEEQHGFSIDGVDHETAVLPDGWRDRLIKVQNANTAAPSGSPRYIGWCLDKEDLCVAKLCAFREKDKTSSQRCSTPGSSTARSRTGWPMSRSSISLRPATRAPGSRLEAEHSPTRGSRGDAPVAPVGLEPPRQQVLMKHGLGLPRVPSPRPTRRGRCRCARRRR
jgi:hypothetical protein